MNRGRQSTTLETNYEDARSIMLGDISAMFAESNDFSSEERNLFRNPDVQKHFLYESFLLPSPENSRMRYGVTIGASVAEEKRNMTTGGMALIKRRVEGMLDTQQSLKIINRMPPLYRSAFAAVLKEKERHIIAEIIEKFRTSSELWEKHPNVSIRQILAQSRHSMDQYFAYLFDKKQGQR